MHLSTQTSIYAVIHLQSGPCYKSPGIQVSDYLPFFSHLICQKHPLPLGKGKKTNSVGVGNKKLCKQIGWTDYRQTFKTEYGGGRFGKLILL